MDNAASTSLMAQSALLYLDGKAGRVYCNILYGVQMNNHPGWTKSGRCIHCGTEDAAVACTLEKEAEHPKDCEWWSDWHACSCGAFDRIFTDADSGDDNSGHG